VRLEKESIEQMETTVTSTVDPTDDVVSWSFPVKGARPTAWTAGTWKADATGVAGSFRAVSVSPTVGATGATVVLAAGTYDAYLKITDNPEVPVRRIGLVRVVG
jgi:hypothetical protein